MISNINISNLLNYAWIEGLIMLVLLKFAIDLVRKLLKVNKKTKKIETHDNIIQIVVFIIFLGVPLFSQFIFGINNIFWYVIIFSIIGISCEFLFDFLWLRLMGTRLYRYYKKNLLGFTSWYIFPYWAAAGLYFYGMWQFITFVSGATSLSQINTAGIVKELSFIALLTFVLVLFLIGIKDYLKGRLSSFSGFRWSKYLLIVLTIWIPILYLVILLNNLYILLYFILTSITGLILEGLLSNKMRGLYGESFWLYYRYEVFNHGTSLLVLPIWGAAALLAFILFNYLIF